MGHPVDGIFVACISPYFGVFIFFLSVQFSIDTVYFKV